MQKFQSSLFQPDDIVLFDFMENENFLDLFSSTDTIKIEIISEDIVNKELFLNISGYIFKGRVVESNEENHLYMDANASSQYKPIPEYISMRKKRILLNQVIYPKI